MCTVTIIPLTPDGDAPDPLSAGYRLATNRDELRTRPTALPPREHLVASVPAIWPVDTLAGGTWVGVNRHGLSLAILNIWPQQAQPLPNPGAAQSRGLIIPRLIDARTAPEAIDRIAGFPLDRFAGFRLVAVDSAAVVEAAWDRRSLQTSSDVLTPTCFVSSGLGDSLVRSRLDLFDSWRAEAAITPERQDAFHRHEWPDRPEISVRMSRADARTVSTTVIEVRRSKPTLEITMTYIADTGISRSTLAGCEPWYAETSGERA